LTTRRLVTAFVIALLVSGMFTLYLSQKFNKRPPAAPKNQYVAAASGFEAGQVIRPENLKLVDWPTSVPLQGAFPTVEGLAGRTVLYPISPGEPLLERQLSAPGAGSGLTTKIPEGMRAISLRSDEIVGVAGFLQPGTHVDVLVTLRSVGPTQEPVTSTVLQDVEVLAAGQKMQPDPEGKPTTTTVVTLLVKPEDAEKVVLASSMGSVHFILRNGTDRETVDGQPVQLSALGGTAPVAPAPAAKLETKRVSVEVAKPYSVETILGAKQKMDSFQ
jgi:pilus assembly protein CpaB